MYRIMFYAQLRVWSSPYYINGITLGLILRRMLFLANFPMKKRTRRCQSLFLLHKRVLLLRPLRPVVATDSICLFLTHPAEAQNLRTPRRRRYTNPPA